MTWTSAPPEKNGYYWMRCEHANGVYSEPIVVEFDASNGRFFTAGDSQPKNTHRWMQFAHIPFPA